jgi:maltooligosyltrehalose trehalohydrolase
MTEVSDSARHRHEYQPRIDGSQMDDWKLSRGATALPPARARFEVWAPLAKSVDLHLMGAEPPARDRVPRLMSMPEVAAGVFALEVEGVPPLAEYAYRLNGTEADVPDPVSRYQPAGVFGPSRVVDPRRFDWTDGDWHGLRMAELIIYELHVGTFSLAGTFEGVAEKLGYLRELGVTAIEIMPVAQFPGARNWGYDGVFPYAVQNSYGGPEGLRRLVNAAHAAGLAVILDVVYNHLGPEGNVLPHYGPYFTDKYKTPWGHALNFDGPDSDEVRRYFIDNALHWISEYHIDGLRLDAVHAICDFSAVNILEEMAAEAHRLGSQLGRNVLIIAESDLNDPRLVRSSERGGFGLDGAWSDDFHHAVHVALTGEQNGYYADFKGAASIARAVQDRYAYGGTYSGFRRRRHGAPAADIPADQFVVFSQNHDQVGNRARGDRLSTIVSFERQKLAAAMVLLSPYVPLLFMGEEYGETNPFLYFVSHHSPELIEAVRKGRSEEFKSFAWQGTVPDPAAESTFQASRLNWDRPAQPGHRELLAMYHTLTRLRQSEPALRPGETKIDAQTTEAPPSVQWRLRHTSSKELVACFNLSAEPVEFAIQAAEADWTMIFSTDARRFGGREADLAAICRQDEITITVPGQTAILLRR